MAGVPHRWSVSVLHPAPISPSAGRWVRFVPRAWRGARFVPRAGRGARFVPEAGRGARFVPGAGRGARFVLLVWHVQLSGPGHSGTQCVRREGCRP